MSDNNVWSKLIEFAEGKLSNQQWRLWWDSHETEIASIMSPLEFDRIRPRAAAQEDSVMDEHCHREVCHLLSLQGIEFIVGETAHVSERGSLSNSQSKNRFAALVTAIAEEKFAASVPCDVTDQWFIDFLKGQKHDAELWIEQRLASIIRWVSERPQWNLQRPNWPWVDGKPLIFVSQTSLPENDVTQEFHIKDQTLYVFARPVNELKSFQVAYEIVAQPRDGEVA